MLESPRSIHLPVHFPHRLLSASSRSQHLSDRRDIELWGSFQPRNYLFAGELNLGVYFPFTTIFLFLLVLFLYYSEKRLDQRHTRGILFILLQIRKVMRFYCAVLEPAWHGLVTQRLLGHFAVKNKFFFVF